MLGPENQVITCSTDRSLRVTLSEGLGTPERLAQLLQLTLRCRGIRFDGVRTEREQEKLRQYSAVFGPAMHLAGVSATLPVAVRRSIRSATSADGSAARCPIVFLSGLRPGPPWRPDARRAHSPGPT